MRAFSTLASLLALSSLVVLPRLAHAQSACTADTDCVKGYTCVVTGGSGCAAPACPPGEKCDPTPPDCVTTEYKSCQPAPCQADSDCADGMVCYTHTETPNCPAVDCPSGAACPQPVCDPVTVSACVPRYMLPCTTADDCGSGFQCEASQECVCSGSAPSGGSSSGSSGSASAGSASTPPPAPEESCTCETSKEMYCHADAVKCSVDSDCLAGWTCAVVASTSDCAGGFAPAPMPSAGSGSGGAGAQDGAGAGAQGGAGAEPTPTPVPDCRPSAEIKQCVPPYYTLVGGIRGVSHDSAGNPTVGSGDGTSTGVAPGVPESGGKVGNGSNTPSDNASGDNSTSSAGCSVTHGAGSMSSTLALFGVLGLFSALRRRRAR